MVNQTLIKVIAHAGSSKRPGPYHWVGVEAAGAGTTITVVSVPALPVSPGLPVTPASPAGPVGPVGPGTATGWITSTGLLQAPSMTIKETNKAYWGSFMADPLISSEMGVNLRQASHIDAAD